MSKQASARIETGPEFAEGGAAAAGQAEPNPAYEPPRLDVLGSLAELTGQDLKVSGTGDFVGFFP